MTTVMSETDDRSGDQRVVVTSLVTLILALTMKVHPLTRCPPQSPSSGWPPTPPRILRHPAKEGSLNNALDSPILSNIEQDTQYPLCIFEDIKSPLRSRLQQLKYTEQPEWTPAQVFGGV